MSERSTRILENFPTNDDVEKTGGVPSTLPDQLQAMETAGQPILIHEGAYDEQLVRQSIAPNIARLNLSVSFPCFNINPQKTDSLAAGAETLAAQGTVAMVPLAEIVRSVLQGQPDQFVFNGQEAIFLVPTADGQAKLWLKMNARAFKALEELCFTPGNIPGIQGAELKTSNLKDVALVDGVLPDIVSSLANSEGVNMASLPYFGSVSKPGKLERLDNLSTKAETSGDIKSTFDNLFEQGYLEAAASLGANHPLGSLEGQVNQRRVKQTVNVMAGQDIFLLAEALPLLKPETKEFLFEKLADGLSWDQKQLIRPEQLQESLDLFRLAANGDTQAQRALKDANVTLNMADSYVPLEILQELKELMIADHNLRGLRTFGLAAGLRQRAEELTIQSKERVLAIAEKEVLNGLMQLMDLLNRSLSVPQVRENLNIIGLLAQLE